jgi:hypothetical protein
MKSGSDILHGCSGRIAITGRGTFDGNAQWEYAPARGQDPEIIEEQTIAKHAGVEMKLSAEQSPTAIHTDSQQL